MRLLESLKVENSIAKLSNHAGAFYLFIIRVMLVGMRHKKNKSGYILVLTMLIIAGMTAVVTYIFNRGMVHIPFVSTMIARQKANMLALGGVDVALAQLSYIPAKKSATEQTAPMPPTPGTPPTPKKSVDQEAIEVLLTRILPALNRFQTFELRHEIDGVDGLLEICIMCEEGKININDIFDFKTQKFIGEGAATTDWKKLLQDLFKKIDTMTGSQDLFGAFMAFLKKQENNKLDDVTQLLQSKPFAVFKDTIYYEPPHTNLKQKKRPLYLTDIFTVHSTSSTLIPWLLSDSLLGLLDIKRAQENDIATRQKQIAQWIQKVKPTTNWKNDWNAVLKPVYEKEFQALPKGIESFFNMVFLPQTFSVRVHATVDGVVQQVFAIIERVRHSQNGEIVYASKIKKMYWL